MKTAMTPEIKDVLAAVPYRPAVSILMPFEPKIGVRSELARQLKFAIDSVDREIRKNYAKELCEPVLNKLKRVVKDLNFSSAKKSIAIFVSPVFEKIIYLDTPVDQKIIVDGSFEIRDLLQSRKELHRYLALVLSAKWSKIYIGEHSRLTEVRSPVPDNVAAFRNDIPERTANFSDPSEREEVLLDKFLRHTDDGLGFLLHADPLPAFVLGAKRVLGHFKSLTKHAGSIIAYIPGNYEEAGESKLHKTLVPFIEDWRKKKMRGLVRQVESAANAKKLSQGVHDAWKFANLRMGRLLVVEKDFIFSAEQEAGSDSIRRTDRKEGISFMKDAVDDLIEKVLENGGDVEFVDRGMLRKYGRIALIHYY